MEKKYHFIGIGGIGVGTIASLMLRQGCQVSGSDTTENKMVRKLREQGARIAIGHAAANLDGAPVVVYSSAVSLDNPELQEAKRRDLRILRRAECLAELMQTYIGITIAGAHGKTTTTAMIANLLIHAGLDPSTAVGGIIRGTENHARVGRGKHFVAEIDESDGTFLCFYPFLSVVTNLDMEHLDYYRSLQHIVGAYQQFIQQTQPQGKVIAWGDQETLKSIVKRSSRRFLTYGFLDHNELQARNIQKLADGGGHSQYDCYLQGRLLGPVILAVPGEHNILNSLAAIAVGLELELSFSMMQQSLQIYQGVKRRFQWKGEVDDISVVDDYGHHPTEIIQTLKTARSLNKKRIITIFQPHRFSRTKFLLEEFISSLMLTDRLIVTDIYAASEENNNQISAQDICDRLKARDFSEAIYLRKEQIVEHILKIVQPGDLVLTLGAGDITQISDILVQRLKERRSPDQVTASLISPSKQTDHIAVVMGGVSPERDVSLKSGKAIYEALKRKGARVSAFDLTSTDRKTILSLLFEKEVDVVFNALHGDFGEDGQLQTILEEGKFVYTGSGVGPSRLAFHKGKMQDFVSGQHINVAAYQRIAVRDLNSLDACRMAFPLVVKPACAGSSFGVAIVRTAEQYDQAVKDAAALADEVIVEQYIRGREVTVGILDGEPLPVIEIRTKREFFDSEAKYQKGLTEYLVPADLPAELAQELQRIALAIYTMIGARDLARMDFMLDEKNQSYFLEANTIPGFTETSLLPMAAQKAGLSFDDLCWTILGLAIKRRTQVLQNLSALL